ncbi:MAG: DUF2314 domain-containing protein [Phycisphaerales bacterium]|jgi:uncharacterized protein YegJ (DUF2314 family)|nr:DUF2314 domain-containing protein [Phycisphaerales bacterium]
MTNEFNIIDFSPLSKDRPWELQQPTPTDLRAVISGETQPTMEYVTKAIATFVGEAIEAELVTPPSDEIPWATRVRVEGLPTDIIIWVEPLVEAARDAAEIESGCILALQTVLHSGDPLTHFSNLMRLLGGANLSIHSVCDLATGRWFPQDILEQVFVSDEVEPPEEILWITRLVEAPEDAEPEDRWCWVSTYGLNRCGRVELEMLGVPAVYTSEAVHIVDGLAALTLETSLPPEGQPMSLGSNLLVSLMSCEKAISMLQDGMPGLEDRSTPTVVITSSDSTSIYPKDAVDILHLGETSVIKTLRSTERSAKLAQDKWELLLKASGQIGESEHAGCMVQVPWAQIDDEESPREYLWFRVIKVNGEEVVGELAHEPDLVKNLTEGQKENITKTDVTDWVLMTPVGPMGPGDSDAIDEFLTQFKS